ncbi:hydrolase 1, exosortase A system-associated [Thiocystis violacea]|uniref:hydrolase 1, exosortase A system-associated n=1 Tax=Thiocystis violacea TaxID=13725 RepID=UPI001905E537|nr:hydrolase 1, exosortase A system-associated [Thiocystis violacea]MBK1725117.1 hydrolase 1, exosortase A system-associated [Thiocystis violacea]
MTYSESPIVFDCKGDRLVGVIATPDACPIPTGVLIVVGGPQYRAGSHRQFTLLARDLAQAGIASLRFDYRGMGDSEGESRTFEAIDSDITVAIDELFAHVPTLSSVAIWGLCDAASAALIYSHQDSRVTSLILLNPWVHTETSGAQARLKYYYLRRLLEPSLWRKLVSGEFRVGASVRDFLDALRATLAQTRWSTRRLTRDPMAMQASQSLGTHSPQPTASDFIWRMLFGLSHFQGQTLLMLSGNDLTASEFTLLTDIHPGWRAIFRSRRITRRIIQEANHTFSSREWRDVASTLTVDFLAHGVQSR